MKINNNKGFSLIEVLVTVGLIGVLVGIAIPSYNGYKQNTVKMALKADLGSGAKVYNAHYAVDSTYCAELESVGLSSARGNNPIYKKKAFYGFTTADTDPNVGCSGLNNDNLHFKSKADYCYTTADTAKKDTNNLITDPSTGATSCPASHTKGSKTELAYGTPPADCKLASNKFRLGAETDVSGLGGTFLDVDQDGKIKEQAVGNGCKN